MKLIKKLSFAAFALLLVMSLSASVFAATVTYKTETTTFEFDTASEEPDDLFESFKDLMPGDVKTQKITFVNTAPKKTSLKLYIKANAVLPEDVELLSKLGLTLKKGDETLFDNKADSTVGLEDWVHFATLRNGETLDLDATLNVPVTLGNEFQEADGAVNWLIKAEEIPDKKTPTGDDNNLVLWIVLVCVCAATGIFVIFFGKKKKDNK